MRTARHLFQRVAADLLDRLALIVACRLAVRGDAFFGAAFEGRHLLIVVVVRRFVQIGALGGTARTNCRRPELPKSRDPWDRRVLRLVGVAPCQVRRSALARLSPGRSETWPHPSLRLRSSAASDSSASDISQDGQRFRALRRRPVREPSAASPSSRFMAGFRSAVSETTRRRPTRASDFGLARASVAAAAAFAARLVLVLAVGQAPPPRAAPADRRPEFGNSPGEFPKSEETVPVSAVIDEGGLQRGLHSRHFREIDVASQRPFACRFEVELFDPVTSQHHHPGFFRVRGVDDHLVCHAELSCGARKRRREPRAVRSAARRRLCWG